MKLQIISVKDGTTYAVTLTDEELTALHPLVLSSLATLSRETMSISSKLYILSTVTAKIQEAVSEGSVGTKRRMF